MHTWDTEGLRKLLVGITEQTGMSQRDLAKMAGVHHAQVSRWKSGTHRPDYESMARLGAALASEHPELGDLTPALLRATGRGALADDASEPPPDLTPECEYEARILASDVIDSRQKRLIIEGHREEEPQHRWCRFRDEKAQDAADSLPAASLSA